VRKVSLGKKRGKEVFAHITPKTKKAAMLMFNRIEEVAKDLKQRFGGSLCVSQEALEDLVATHGEEAIKGLDEDMRFEGLVSAALDGNSKAYQELHSTESGKKRISQIPIRKPR
jgi:hypothetical protein